MDANLANGGLVVKTGDKLLLSDVRNYSGTLILDIQTGKRFVSEGVFWFMNNEGRTIYYSDHKRGSSLCAFDLQDQTVDLLLESPCYGIIQDQGWLYYINETDMLLYRCLLNGKEATRLTDEQVICFLLDNGTIYYSTARSIRTCSVNGGFQEQLAETHASIMLKLGNRLIYADKEEQHALTLLDLHSGHAAVMDEIAPSSLNTDGKYLYCTNRNNGKSIYRIDVEQRRSIRICGDSADYLHIIEDEIFYNSNREWFRMSLLGGQAQSVMS